MAVSVKGDAFGPQPPPLLEYLQQILRGYSDGQILKELLQNAEDAGASEVTFIYDKRQFGTTNLFEKSLSKYQGPALLAFNNAEFSEEDWRAIQRPARSDKKENAMKVGRFGIGFSSVYHLTDLPCIISGTSIAIIDPFEKHFTDANKRPVPGSKWNLADVSCKESCSDQLAPFQNSFPDQNRFWQRDYSFKGTIFRFPLRGSPSDLCTSVYSDDKMEDVLASFKQEASVVLLFLRNVERISILKRQTGSDQPSPYLDVRVTSGDTSNFRNLRKNFCEMLESDKGFQEINEDIEMSVKLDVSLEDHCGPKVSKSWISCQVIAHQCSKELKDLANRLHFLPWVGVAISLNEDHSAETPSVIHLDGRIFCFLPLPHGEASLSGLPVHVHGYFGVSDDRRSLKWPGGDQIQNETALWNKILIEELLPGVYLKAVLKAIEVCRDEEKGPGLIYSALPNIGAKLGNWEGMINSFYKEIFRHPVLYVERNETWEHIDKVIINNMSDCDPETGTVVLKSLSLGRFLVVENLPPHVLEAIKTFATNAKFVNVQNVLLSLHESRLDNFEPGERLCLLTYLLDNNCNAQDLSELELLPVAEGIQFTKFTAFPRPEDIVYIPTDQCKDELLPHLKHKFVGSLKSQFQGLQRRLRAMGSSDRWLQIRQLTPKLVVSLLKQTLPVEWKGEYTEKTYLDEENGFFNRGWLRKVWEFAFHNLQLTELEGLNLLPITEVTKNPVQVVTLRQGSKVVSCSSSERKRNLNVATVLSRLGVIVCDLPSYVTKHYNLFGFQFAHHLDSNGVMCFLRKSSQYDIERFCQDDPYFREKFHGSLLPFLNCRNMTNEDKSFINNLQIFQACNKLGDFYFTSISSDVFLLEDGWEKRLPNVSLPRMILNIKHRVVRSFCQQMGVNEMKMGEIVQEILESFQRGDFLGKEREVLISWIGKSFRNICHTEGNLDILRRSAFIPNGSYQERRICDIFTPSDNLLKTLLNDNSYFPSENFLQRDGGVWNHILPQLGYLTQVNVDQYHLKKVADEISLQRSREQARALCSFLAVKPELLSEKIDRWNTLGDYLGNVAFMQCKTDRPLNYPRHLPFHGELMQGSLFTPKELVQFVDKNWKVAGSSALLTDVVISEEIGIRKEPSVEEVCNHLQQLIEHFSVNTYQDTSMLHGIYKFLNDQASGSGISCHLPQDWIWTGDGFKSPAHVCLEDTVVDLRPFMYVIPREYRHYRQLYQAVQISVNVTTEELLQLLGRAKSSLDFQDEKDVKSLIDLAIRILRRLLETEIDLKQHADEIFVPTKTNELLAPDQVSFCDFDWLKHSQLTGEEATQIYNDIKLISDEFSIPMARRLGVVPLSSRVAMADEIVEGISQTGQYESITTRIRNILNDAGYQTTSIPKEMIQNAEDAEATEVRFLIDFRSNEGAKKRLLDEAMAPLQGPALWVYNNSVFSDSDLENIKKLGGGTKKDDGSKIGKFGLGFNSVYHITDVPSFVTRHFVNFFDPHRKFLQSQIRRDGRGICLDFKKNPRVMMMFRDQFQPYDGIFGCNLSSNAPDEYPATLFRLPLRGPNEARDSEINRECFTESKLNHLMKSVCDTSNQMLLFTENVRLIEVYLLKDEGGVQPTLLFSASKEIINQTPKLSLPFRKEVFKNVKDPCGNMPPDTVFELNIKPKLTEFGRQYFQNISEEMSAEDWITVMSAGKGTALSLCREKIGNEAGLIPYGGIAWKKCPSGEILKGQIFCCLPLSVQSSCLPVHINGGFALSDDRAKLWPVSSYSIDAMASFKSKWNKALFEDVILSAYFTFLEQDLVAKFCCDSGKRYCLWPNLNETSTNGDCGVIVSSFYSAVVNGLNTQGAPSIFWNINEKRRLAVRQIAFLDQRFERKEKEFEVASNMITRCGKARMVFRLPQHVNEGFANAGCSSFLNQQSYSFARFFKEILLPNLENYKDEAKTLLQFALAECDQEVLALMKINKCIPASPRGDEYKKPSDLFDPKALGELFLEEEGFFPSDSFLRLLNDRQRGTLRDMGSLKTTLEWTVLIDRAKTIPYIWGQNKNHALQRYNALMNAIEGKLRNHEPESEKYKETFKQIPFIPCKNQDLNEVLKCANEVFPKTEEDLVGTVSSVVDYEIPSSVNKYLDLDGKKPHSDLVLENLSNLAEQNKKGLRFLGTFQLRQICIKIYHYLQGQLRDENVVTFLREKDCFLMGDTFVSAAKLSFNNDAVPPYIYQVNTYLKEFHSLLKTANVKDRFSANDLIKVLMDMQAEFLNEPLKKTMLDDVLAKVVKPLANTFESSEFVFDDLTQIYLPDAKGILRLSSHLAFCDVEWLNPKGVILCHRDIPLSQALVLGVRDIRHQLLESYSEAIPGEEFGQREELTGRLKRILSGYPCDVSILKELVQNADDTGATEIHFILDMENYPTERLLKDSMKSLQGPALLCFNDKPFTDEDIRGIQKLGEGSKRYATVKTGRYGVGFNVVYHLTDCPMFMSGADQICVMDPTLKYVPGASVKSPGRKYVDVHDGLKTICPDFLECFSTFSDLLDLHNGTLFRFPLRKQESELSNEEWSSKKVLELMNSFKDEMFDVLLFLKSVRKICISTREKDGKELKDAYTVEANLSNQDKCDRMKFFAHINNHANTPLKQIPVWNNCCEMVVKASNGYKEHWLVQQSIGLDNENIPSSILEALQSGRVDVKFLPKGGVASRLPIEYFKPNSDFKHELRHLEHKAFCFLPLPLSTNLPVHIDGYFALDHEARRNLWYGPVGDPKSDWNRLIKEMVIARAYIKLLQEVKKRVIALVKEHRSHNFVTKVLNYLHSLLPKCDKENKENVWNCLPKSVYNEIIKEKYQLFPVMSYILPSHPEDEKVEISWKSCIKNANESGYFDDLSNTFHNEHRGENEKENWEVLQGVLIRLEFPLLSTPLEVYNSIVNAFDKRNDEVCIDEDVVKSVLKVSPDSVINFLKEDALFASLKDLPKKLEETPIKTKKALGILIEYVKKIEDQKDRKFESKLDGLPLLLTCDGILRSFSSSLKVFSSSFQNLLSNCKNEFLHENFRVLISEESNVFKKFEIRDLSERLDTQLSELDFGSGNPVPWSHSPLTQTTPSVKWLQQVWKFLSEMKVSFKSRELFVKECVTYLGEWALIPVKIKKKLSKGGMYLIPLAMGKVVLSSDYHEVSKDVYNILMNLEAPKLDMSVLRLEATPFTSRPYSFSSDMNTFLEIAKAFVTEIENLDDVLETLDYLLKNNYQGFSSLEKHRRKCILEHMARGAIQLVKKHGDSVLKRLPCYESIEGTLVPINRKAYSIEISVMPAEGYKVWLTPSSSIFLKKDKIPDELSKALNVEELDEAELYRKFILPHFTSFPEKTMWYHIEKIMNMVVDYRIKAKERETLIEKLSLRNVPLIMNRSKQIKVACELFDPDLCVFKVMLTEDCFPAMFKMDGLKDQNSWLQFLRLIGMKTEVTSLQFLKFAENISFDVDGAGRPNFKDELKCQRDRVLFEHLNRNHKLHSDDDLLSKLSKIPFISPHPTDKEFCKLFAPISPKKVTTNATLARDCVLVWSIKSIGPNWIDARYDYCNDKQSNKTNCMKHWKEKLGVNTGPKLTDVIQHTQTICNTLAFASNMKGKAVTIYVGTLMEVIRKILTYLSGQCSHRKEGQKVCRSKLDCCETCKLISEQLDSVPFVPVDGGKVLAKARMVVKNMIIEENCNILTYLKKVPDELVPYFNTLQCIGATEQPTLEQYACVLETISNLSDVTNDPNLIVAAKQAMSGFLRCLNRKQHDEHTKQTLLAMPTLHLMSKSKDEPIVRSNDLFYSDVVQLRKRLSEFPYPLLKAISSTDLGTSVNVDELLKSLPEHLTPRFISEYVEERMVTNVEDAEEECNCQFSRKLKRTASWGQFPTAIQCIIAYELKTESSIHIDSKMEELMRSRFIVKCIPKLETALYFEGREIPSSLSDTSCLFTKNQENHEVVIYLSHNAYPLNRYRQLAKSFNDTFKLVSNISYLELILQAENEEDLSNLLNSENIGTGKLEEESFWNLPELGTNVQNDVIALLNQDIMHIFFENEYVGYDCGVDGNELLIYARVSKRIDDEFSNDKPWRLNYEVEVGENERRHVPAFKLYKFIPVDNPDRFAVTVYTGPSCDEAEGQNIPGVERSEEGTDDPPDLGATKREVTATLEDIMTMPEEDKKKTIRRLLLKWHPDKNSTKKQFAQEIFKHIQSELDRLQNINMFSRGSFYDDVDQRARRDEEEQRQWQEQYQASSSSRNQRHRRHQRGFYPPPSFHRKKNTLEGIRHFKQARADFGVAERLENSTFCCQWKCQLYFFASEKAIKAAQLVTGKHTPSENGILRAAEDLQDELDVTDSVRGLVHIVSKDSHYPDSVASPGIPQDAFTPEQARRARDFSRDILTAVARHIGCDEDGV